MIRIIPLSVKILTGQRGAVLPLVALLMVGFLGFAAFAVDFGYIFVVKNELQNAADAAALAGASVMFNDNGNCISSGRPYTCCTGPGTGTCDPIVIDIAGATSTATDVATRNFSGANPAPAPIVEIGHYEFPSAFGESGTFTPTVSSNQLDGWQTRPFSDLNVNTNFINAVRVTVTRTDVPRFFSVVPRVFGSSPFIVSVHAVAYVGFAGSSPSNELNAPIAICKQYLVTDPNCPTDCIFTCRNNWMIDSRANNPPSNTAAWINFTQEPNCNTASNNDIRWNDCSADNPVLFLGKALGTTDAQQTTSYQDVYNCWLRHCDPLNPSNSNPQSCTQPWQMTLPVIDCSYTNPGPCKTLVGAVGINLIWMWPDPPQMNIDALPQSMTATIYDPLTDTYTSTTWNYSQATTNCTNNCSYRWWISNCVSKCRWDSFVRTFRLRKADGNRPVFIDPYWNETGLSSNGLANTMFFVPECTPRSTFGTTGGENFGSMSQSPVLVKWWPPEGT